MLSNRLAGRHVTGTTSISRFRHTPWLVLVPLLSGMVLAGTAGCAGQITGSPTVQAIPPAVSAASLEDAAAASEAATTGVTSSAATSATDTTLTGATATSTTATSATASVATAPGAEQPGGDAAPLQPQQQQPQQRAEQQPAEPAQPQAPADPAVGADPADRTTDDATAKPGLAEQTTADDDVDTASRIVTSTAMPLATPTARQLPTPSPTQVPTGLPGGQPQITVTVQVADTCDSGSTIAPSFQIGTRNATAVAVTAIRNGQASAVDTGGFALTGFTVVQFAGTNFQCVGVDGFVNTETVQFVATGPGGSATTTVQVSVAAK